MKITKQFIQGLFYIYFGMTCYAQTGIGTTTPNRSAILDVSGTTGGLLPPRMTYNQMNAIVSPAEGLMIYCTNCDLKGLYYYDGTNFLNYGTGHVGLIASSVVTATGRTWMDRNLGASKVASSSADAASYGDLYQWGRGADGHELRSSGTTNILSNSDIPGHGDFILAPTDDDDWRDPQNDNLWQGISGINNPCPYGYRLPTEQEWEAERATWTSQNTVGAFTSPLKLPAAGSRYHDSGNIMDESLIGNYWSGTVHGYYTSALIFDHYAGIDVSIRAEGFSVRCIKD